MRTAAKIEACNEASTVELEAKREAFDKRRYQEQFDALRYCRGGHDGFVERLDYCVKRKEAMSQIVCILNCLVSADDPGLAVAEVRSYLDSQD